MGRPELSAHPTRINERLALLHLTLDTSCVVNLLSSKEESSPDLLELMRLALDGRVRLSVTDVVGHEVPKEHVDEVLRRRTFIYENLKQFPVTGVADARLAERDSLAQEFLSALWPNVEHGSRKHGNSFRDCQHLASHRICDRDIFVTLDLELARKALPFSEKYQIVVLRPSEALNRVDAPTRGLVEAANWDPVVRTAQSDDRSDIKALLAPIRDSYDDFDGWLKSALTGKQVWLAHLDGRIGAVAVWSHKTESTIKLATFFVGDEYRRRALGPHLLFKLLRHWISINVSKVFVTVSSERPEAMSFFLEYGFRLEGYSARRYKSSAVEFVMAKHFVYNIVQDHTLDRFLTHFGAQVFDLPSHGPMRSAANWFLPPKFGPLSAVRSDQDEVIGFAVKGLAEKDREISIGEMEELAYPARFALNRRKAYMIPIMPRWADRLISVPRNQVAMFGHQDKLALRTDNAYYCSPVYADVDLEDAPALFYVSNPDQIVAGFARIVERHIAEPEDLYMRYERLGIYGVEDIRTHVKKTGSLSGYAMAIRFAWWVPFPNPVSLERLRQMGLHHPQKVEAIDYTDYERLLEAGGVTW